MCLFFTNFSRASDCLSSEVIEIGQRDFSGIETFVASQPDASLDCLIRRLPEDVRAFRTYIKSSLSLQEASIKNPRALVGSSDGGFFLTFNGHENQKGFNEIEFLALDSNSNPTAWVAGSIKSTNGRLEIVKNPRKCQSCHGNPVRPIWGKYPLWPNAFGSIDDWLPSSNTMASSPFYGDDMEDGRLDTYARSKNPIYNFW